MRPAIVMDNSSMRDYLTEVTGIQSAIVYPTDTVSLTIDSTIVRDYSFSVMNSVINPLFIITDKKAESYGLIDGTGQVGFASKKLAESTSWFIALPPDNQNLWRYIFQKAGVHIYNDQGDIFYSGSEILTHSHKRRRRPNNKTQKW